MVGSSAPVFLAGARFVTQKADSSHKERTSSMTIKGKSGIAAIPHLGIKVLDSSVLAEQGLPESMVKLKTLTFTLGPTSCPSSLI